MGPAFIEFQADQTGSFRFIAVEGWMDCAHGRRDGRPCVEFSWDGDDDGDLGGAGVIDGFACLRHDAVIGGDDDDRDVRYLRAAGAHGGKCLVTWSIQEGDFLTIDFNLIGADVLGNAPCFTCRDFCFAYHVE